MPGLAGRGRCHPPQGEGGRSRARREAGARGGGASPRPAGGGPRGADGGRPVPAPLRQRPRHARQPIPEGERDGGRGARGPGGGRPRPAPAGRRAEPGLSSPRGVRRARGWRGVLPRSRRSCGAGSGLSARAAAVARISVARAGAPHPAKFGSGCERPRGHGSVGTLEEVWVVPAASYKIKRRGGALEADWRTETSLCNFKEPTNGEACGCAGRASARRGRPLLAAPFY